MMKKNNAPVSQAIVPSNIFLPFTLIYDMFVSVDSKDVLIETSVCDLYASKCITTSFMTDKLVHGLFAMVLVFDFDLFLKQLSADESN